MLKRLLLVLVAVLLLADVGLSESLPKVEVQQPVFDFGEVMRGQKVVHTFVFRNSGEAMLVVDRVKSTCGCTGVLLAEKNIPPGGEGTVKATFNSSKFKGYVEKRILLYSNDPDGNPTSFTVKGIVKLPLEAKPVRAVFDAVAVGQSKTVTIVLTNRSGKPITLGNLRASTSFLRAEVEVSALESGESTELWVTAEPGAKDAHLNGTVFVRFDQSGRGEIRIPVSGRVVDPSGENR